MKIGFKEEPSAMLKACASAELSETSTALRAKSKYSVHWADDWRTMAKSLWLTILDTTYSTCIVAGELSNGPRRIDDLQHNT